MITVVYYQIKKRTDLVHLLVKKLEILNELLRAVTTLLGA